MVNTRIYVEWIAYFLCAIYTYIYRQKRRTVEYNIVMCSGFRD
jgi:hypothetical protein